MRPLSRANCDSAGLCVDLRSSISDADTGLAVGKSDEQRSASRVFACGVAVAGAHATWPLAQLEMGEQGIMIKPRWPLGGLLFPPVYEFAWGDVDRVDLLMTFGAPRGPRFALARPAQVRRPLGALFAFWPEPVRRLRVGLRAADLEAAIALLPNEVPLMPRRWLGP